MKNASARTAMILSVIVIAMIGLSYASVPLYRMFCKVTGWGGTPQITENTGNTGGVTDDLITVRFDANVDPALPWAFRPMQQSVQVRLGEEKKVFYRIHNKSSKPITGTATFNVTPVQAGAYFNKTYCFCFEPEELVNGATKELPVVFYVDPKIKDDPDLKGIKTITLSYTYFKDAEQNKK